MGYQKKLSTHQKKIIQSKVLIIGMGGLGCPVAEFLTRAGVGTLGVVDNDKDTLNKIASIHPKIKKHSNLH